MTSAFTFNGANIAPPSGSIIAYMGTSDPSGWIICDGVQRTDGATGKYNNIIAMGLGTGTVNAANYTPPNYKGAFLRWTGTQGSYVGPSIGVSQTDQAQLVSHNHTASQDAHSHTVDIGSIDDSNWTGLQNQYPPSDSYTKKGTTYTTNSAQPNVYVGSTGNTNETRPYNYGVNWILKL